METNIIDEKNVMIGDYLGMIEEFFSGPGTYAEDGKIYAAIIGKKIVDDKKREVEVVGDLPHEIRVGSLVFGEVQGVKKNNVTVIVKKIKGVKNSDIEIRTGLYVSNISDGYIKEPKDVFGIGDIVKGKVIKIDNDLIDISTKSPELGCVKAFCKKCRNPLKRTGDNKKKEKEGENGKEVLVCKNCGNKEERKIANDYDNVEDI